MRSKILISLGVIVLLAGAYLGYRYLKYYKEPAPKAVEITQVWGDNTVQDKSESPEQEPEMESFEAEEELADSLNLNLPFYSQAPFGDWDYPWQEACEEASVLLVANTYLDKNWTREEFNQEILDLVDWQMDEFGDYIHTDMPQTAQMLEDNFGLESIIHTDPNLQDIKEILNKGHLIIMPLAGQQIGNPFYTGEGPIYHVLVVKGYKGDKLVTHDVGTRRGEDYVYAWDVLEPALHDWNEPINSGEKRILEVLPPMSG